MINDLMTYEFIRNAFIGAILASIACGIIGTIIVEKKLVMMSGGIAHTSFGGIGMGYFLGIEPIIGGLIFSIAAALGIVSIKRSSNTNSDTLIGMFWAAGMALGMIFVGFMPSYPPDMASYLFGDILAVSQMDLLMMIVLDLVICFVIFSGFNYWKAYLFDEEFATVMKVNTRLLEYVLFILIAMTIVALIRVVGILLVIALLTIPPAVSKMLTRSLIGMMLLSTFLGILFCVIGLGLSNALGLPSGATIILTSIVVYILVYGLEKSGIKGKLGIKSF